MIVRRYFACIPQGTRCALCGTVGWDDEAGIYYAAKEQWVCHPCCYHRHPELEAADQEEMIDEMLRESEYHILRLCREAGMIGTNDEVMGQWCRRHLGCCVGDSVCWNTDTESAVRHCMGLQPPP